MWRTFIKSHDDITADNALDVHHFFGAEQMFAAINMRLKHYTFFIYLPVVGQ